MNEKTHFETTSVAECQACHTRFPVTITFPATMTGRRGCIECPGCQRRYFMDDDKTWASDRPLVFVNQVPRESWTAYPEK